MSQVRSPFPESTYRLQLHAGFTFRQASEIVPYLRELGITHCYASPYMKARAGSTHGYDVVDHNSINAEIGSQEDFEAWIKTMREHGIEQVLDIVPNHTGVGTNENTWWNDVLENGPASRFASFFDISWRGSNRPDLHDRVLLPVLGAPYGEVLEKGELRLTFENGTFAVNYYDRRFPISPPTYPRILGLPTTELDDRNEPDLREYREIVTALDDLPRDQERSGQQEQLKCRLASLAERSARVRVHIASNVDIFNGKPGNPRSFDLLDDLLTRQCYRLGYWKIAPDEINYRRFFDVNELAALSMERPEVFEASHRLILRLLAQAKLAGLRIDHPDGLYDPKQYLLRLQRAYLAAIGRREADQTDGELVHQPPLYVVVEKILALGESLPNDWPVHGTTGYDALHVINGLFVDRANVDALTRLYDHFIGKHTDYEDLAYQKKLLILDASLASELQMLCAQLARLALHNRRSRDFTQFALREALRRVIACFPVYRSYISDERIREEDRKAVDRAIDAARRTDRATSSAVYDFLRDMLLQHYPQSATEAERREQLRFAGKFQQLTAPVTAKGIEDTAFYVYNRLVSLNEVGGDPGHFGISPDTAHAYLKDRQQSWAHGLTPLSTHDTKRSEDVRARINVLSEIPEEWSARVRRWRELNEPHRKSLNSGVAPSANDEYLLYQTLVGAFPFRGTGQAEYAAFVSRIGAYMQKAMREAKVHTRWTDPNAEYESAVAEFVARILDPQTGGPFLDDFRPFEARVSHWGMLNSLSQTLLRLSTPGVPDTYQGSELWDLSLVDPDNRRPVDYEIRQRALHQLREDFATGGSRRGELAHELAANPQDGRVKLFIIWQMLELRRQLPGLFSSGDYIPVDASGSRGQHLFSFMRHGEGQSALIAVPRLITRLASATASLPLGAGVWHETRLILPATLPAARWKNIFTGEVLTAVSQGAEPSLVAAELFAGFPVAALISE